MLVDDLLIDAPDEVLLALALHPNVEIRIYNPVHNIGTPLHADPQPADRLPRCQPAHARQDAGGRRAARDHRRSQHGRQYFDFDHGYNFRDRDALVIGAVVPAMRASFERFWASPLAVPVERLYDGIGLMRKHVTVAAPDVQRVYRGLAGYAADPANFEPELRAAIADLPRVPRDRRAARLGSRRLSQRSPGKNDGRDGLGGGGLTPRAWRPSSRARAGSC